MKLQPGWADAIAPAVASKDEQTRSAALGLAPRRNFRIDRARMASSAARGGRKGAISKARARKTKEDGQ